MKFSPANIQLFFVINGQTQKKKKTKVLNSLLKYKGMSKPRLIIILFGADRCKNCLNVSIMFRFSRRK